MNLALYEDVLLRALREQIRGDIDWAAGPAQAGPATGLRAQVFVHVARYADGGGVTAQGACTARQPVAQDGATGFEEQRPGTIDIEISCLCARHAQAHQLAGLVTPLALEALETLAPPLLGDPQDRLRQLRFADDRAHVQAQASQRLVHEGVAAALVVVTLRLEGFLHLRLARPGGLARRSAYAQALRLEIHADPAGRDLQAEHVVLRNDDAAAVDLSGWTLRDAARRPHVYTFAAGRRLAAGAVLRLWSGRGPDDAGNVYWGRRAAVWNNTGDEAVLSDPEGAERARAAWSPPLPEMPTAPLKRRRPR